MPELRTRSKGEGKMKYITLTDLREWIFAYDRQEITMSRFQELINEKVERILKEGSKDAM
jgi:hypothetical protein